MRIPEAPPSFQDILRNQGPNGTDLMVKLVARGLRSEVRGEYLHWDQLRRLPAPAGLNSTEWWLSIWMARSAVTTPLPLKDKKEAPFKFVRTDALQRALHLVDRRLGGPHETSDPQLVTAEQREQYLITSLMEEAITSSQLEGAATTRQVAKEMLLEERPARNKSERMILNNYQAMQAVRQRAAKPLTPAFLLELHEILMEGTLPDDEVGRFRRADEAIYVHDRADGQILHHPPDAATLDGRIEALCDFANADGAGDEFVHPVVRAILLHFMLAYDHPFVDGNGRTARALFYWSMLRQGYWIAEFLPISRLLHKAPGQYSRAFLFTETDGGDVTYFLLHQLDVLLRARQDLESYLAHKAAEVREVETALRGRAGLNHRQKAILAHALRHPGAVYSIELHQRQHGVVYQTARQDLLGLAKEGYLEQSKRGRAFVFTPVPDLERRLKGRRKR